MRGVTVFLGVWLVAREPCAAYGPLRRPLFGDTHVHTALSFDANTRGTRNLPRDAYRFAKGEKGGLHEAGQRPRGARALL